MNEQIQVEVIARVPKGSKGYSDTYDIQRRIYGIEGIAPTLRTFGGGNLEPKVLIYGNCKNPSSN